MKNEHEEIRALFDALTPDEAQREKMCRAVLTPEAERTGKRLSVKPVLAAAVAAMVCAVGVCAGVPVVREYINMLFLRTDSVTRLTEVPEGWIGVYTAEDLEAVRENLGGSYILMNDIVIPDEYYQPGGIYENGFVPIGNEAEPYTLTLLDDNGVEYYKYVQNDAFTGSFNGNGYTISNVHISTGGEWSYVGLFGQVETVYLLNDKQEWTYDEDGTPVADCEYGYDAETSGGIIKNLGVTDSSIRIDVSGREYNKPMYVGMLTGIGDFIVGCYTDNVTIEYTGADSYTYQSSQTSEEAQAKYRETYQNAVTTDRICIGGIAGEAVLIDSCWSGADIVIDAPEPPENKLYTAGVCGFSTSCVTSYFCGSIESPAADWEVSYSVQNDPPVFLTDAVMREILFRLLDNGFGNTLDRADFEGMNSSEMMRFAFENEPEGSWDAAKFAAFYATCQYSRVQDFMTYDVTGDETGEYPWLLDPYLKARERRELSRLISTVFEGEEFIEFCQNNGVKYGAYDNYDLRREPDCAFEGFDFDYIWKWGEDGLPKLRLSSGATREYYVPEQGIVSADSRSIPYLMLDTEAAGDGIYGYWRNETAQFWVETQKNYDADTPEDLLDGRAGDVMMVYVHWDRIADANTYTYHVTVPELTAEEAMEGITFDGDTVRFAGMPVQYQPYVKEENCLRLTLIPLAEDLTTFAAELDYTDDRAEALTLHTAYKYEQPAEDRAVSPMYLRDAEGSLYPFTRISHSNIYTLEETPAAPITAFVSEMLEFSADTEEYTSVTVPVPAEGEMLETDISFTFPDGVTEGKILAVGHSTPVYEMSPEEHPYSTYTTEALAEEYPMGYLTVVTEASEQDGIRYWYDLTYGGTYHDFLQPYLTEESRMPGNGTPMDPMVPKYSVGRWLDEYRIIRTDHYIADGEDTVELRTIGYRAAAPGDWTIEFSE